jgi:hypothetical protein
MTPGALEGQVWAYDVTDYAVIGFEDPLGDVHTDWAQFPLRIPAGTTGPITLSVYDVAGLDHKDDRVDDNGSIDLTVSPDLRLGAGRQRSAPTTAESLHVEILDDADFGSLTLPTTVWINVSDSAPDSVGFSTFHLDVTL